MTTTRRAAYTWQEVPEDVKALWLSTVASSSFRINTTGLRLTMGFTENPPTDVDLFDVVIRRSASGNGVAFDAYLTLRRAADDATFGDAVLHALGHVVFFGAFASNDTTDGPTSHRAQISSWFTRNGHPATSADWYPPTWELRTYEAIAEFFKDVYRSPRKHNNRTEWAFDPAHFGDFQARMAELTCAPEET